MKRLAVSALTASTAAIIAAYLVAFLPGNTGRLSAMLMILGLATMAVSLMTLGGVREGDRFGLLGVAFAFVFVVFVLGFGIPLLMPATESATAPLWLGLPPRAAIIVYGVGFLPVFVLPFVYARTFEQRTLKPEDLERIRSVAKENAAARARDEVMP
jgi:hypothetical protein